jgi:hypothetical protein
MHTHYRTLVIGILLALAYMYVCVQARRGTHVRLRPLAVVAVLVIIGVLLFINPSSSLGRWFILKKAVGVFVRHWWQGAGNYTAAFNHTQAAYFAGQPTLHTREALLAGDGYYCNNEFLQLGIEHGIAPVLLLLLLTIYFMARLRQSVKQQLTLQHAIIATLIPFMLALFLSYPLHQPIPAAIFCLLFALLIGTDKDWQGFRKVGAFSGIAIGVLLAGGFINKEIRHRQYKKQFAAAVQVAAGGASKKAIQLLLQLQNNPAAAQNYAGLLASLYHQTAQTGKAIAMLEEWHNKACNQALHAQLADYYLAQNNIAAARYHYFTSLYIKPGLLQPRLQLAQLYAATGQPDSASYWTKDLLAYPVKVNSEQARQIRKKAAALLKKVE